MSSSKAIRAVTEKLLLVLANQTPTAKTPDNADKSPLNVFLYQVALNGAWRNQDLPAAGKGGQPGRPLLPLNLYYLISAGEEDQKEAHDKLGQAMLKLHDHPVLTGFNASSGIRNQTDPIRLTHQPLTLDEISKLWSAFQTPYRPSVAYEVGVVLIESEIPEPSPLPVTRRGSDGTGWDASTQLPAVISSVRFSTSNQPGMRLTEKVTLIGQNLIQPGKIQIAFRHPLVKDVLLVDPGELTDSEVTVTIPNEPIKWPPGIYAASLQYTTGTDPNERTLSTNAYPVTLLPEIVVPPAGLMVVPIGEPNFNRSLLMPCRPNLKAEQRVQLVVGNVVMDNININISNPSKPIAKWKDSDVKFPPVKTCYARLRVDGIDSLVYDPADLDKGFEAYLIKGLP